MKDLVLAMTILYRVENLDKGLLDKGSVAVEAALFRDCDKEVSSRAEIEYNKNVVSFGKVPMHCHDVGVTGDLNEKKIGLGEYSKRKI